MSVRFFENHEVNYLAGAAVHLGVVDEADAEAVGRRLLEKTLEAFALRYTGDGDIFRAEDGLSEEAQEDLAMLRSRHAAYAYESPVDEAFADADVEKAIGTWWYQVEYYVEYYEAADDPAVLIVKSMSDRLADRSQG